MPTIEVRLLELIDDYPVEIELFLDSCVFSVAVGADVEEPSRHYPGHKEMWINVDAEPAIKPTDNCPLNYVPGDIEELIVGAVEQNEPEVPELWERLEEAAKPEPMI